MNGNSNVTVTCPVWGLVFLGVAIGVAGTLAVDYALPSEEDLTRREAAIQKRRQALAHQAQARRLNPGGEW